MVKRAKRVPVAVDHPTPSSYAPVGEDYSRARLKIRSLKNDYQDLAQENDAMKRRLHEAKHKKRLLLAQVKFLREKYVFLMENPRNLGFRPEESQKKFRQSKSISKPPHPDKSLPFHTATHLQHPAGMDIPQSSMRMVDKAAAAPSKETFSRNKFLGLDLNETSVPSMDESNDFHHGSWLTNPPASAWEKQMLQLHHHNNPEPVVDPTPAADLNLSACRGMGKDASTRPGKRKITWQDQVALRV